MPRFSEYQVIGRRLPTATEPTPKLYRMRIFAPSEIVAKSRFWYFLRQLEKAKAATGEIVAVNKVRSCWSIFGPICPCGRGCWDVKIQQASSFGDIGDRMGIVWNVLLTLLLRLRRSLRRDH